MNIGTHFAAVWFATHHRVTANTLQGKKNLEPHEIKGVQTFQQLIFVFFILTALPLGMIVATLSMPKLVQSPDDMPRAVS